MTRVLGFRRRIKPVPPQLAIPGTGGGKVTHAARAAIMRPAPITHNGNLVRPGSRITGAIGQAITSSGVGRFLGRG